MLVLVLCHTVIPETKEGNLFYHASSPDEEALLKAANELGVVFKARTPDAVIIEMVSMELVDETVSCFTHCHITSARQGGEI